MSGTSFRRLMIIGAVAMAITVAAVANAQTQVNVYDTQDLVSDTASASVPAADGSLINGWGL